MHVFLYKKRNAPSVGIKFYCGTGLHSLNSWKTFSNGKFKTLFHCLLCQTFLAGCARKLKVTWNLTLYVCVCEILHQLPKIQASMNVSERLRKNIAVIMLVQIRFYSIVVPPTGYKKIKHAHVEKIGIKPLFSETFRWMHLP